MKLSSLSIGLVLAVLVALSHVGAQQPATRGFTQPGTSPTAASEPAEWAKYRKAILATSRKANVGKDDAAGKVAISWSPDAVGSWPTDTLPIVKEIVDGNTCIVDRVSAAGTLTNGVMKYPRMPAKLVGLNTATLKVGQTVPADRAYYVEWNGSFDKAYLIAIPPEAIKGFYPFKPGVLKPATK